MSAYYSVSEAADMTGVSPVTIRGMLRDNVIPGLEQGNRWLLPESSVEVLEQLLEDTEEQLAAGDYSDEEELEGDDDGGDLDLDEDR